MIKAEPVLHTLHSEDLVTWWTLITAESIMLILVLRT